MYMPLLFIIVLYVYNKCISCLHIINNLFYKQYERDVIIFTHIATVPACSSGTLTIMLPHLNGMLQTQDMTLHPIAEYRHRTEH